MVNELRGSTRNGGLRRKRYVPLALLALRDSDVNFRKIKETGKAKNYATPPPRLHSLYGCPTLHRRGDAACQFRAHSPAIQRVRVTPSR